MNWFVSHPFWSGILAYVLVSNFVDALQMVPPKPTDSRLFVFLYTFAMGIAGNTTTLLKHLLRLDK